MLFNSHEFIFLYFPIVAIGFFAIAKTNRQLSAIWLGLASLFFYGWWNPQYVLLLMASIVFNYLIGVRITQKRVNENLTAKLTLGLGVTANLLLLLYFKYTNFFILSLNQVAGFGLEVEKILLPLGISFFTFTQIAFLADAYKGKAKEYNFAHYLLFVTYFPHLIAGPVLHHKQMMPQFSNSLTYIPNWENISIGLTFFSIGLAKKVLIADSFSEYATPVFNVSSNGVNISLFTSWLGALTYTFQLYFDFSGYSDMAIGLAKILGVNLPENFNSPYKAKNIIDFWRRWHMTLSQFLRDYLYIPLGGNRNGTLRRHLNLFMTMLLGGLWHGANWTYVIWGALHGIYLIINHVWNYMFPNIKSRVWDFFSILITFLCSVFAWVFFRSESISSAINIIKGMLGLNGISFPVSLNYYAPVISKIIPDVMFSGITPELAVPINLATFAMLIVCPLLFVFLLPNSQEMISKIQNSSPTIKTAASVFMGALFAASVLSFSKVSEFLYFQF